MHERPGFDRSEVDEIGVLAVKGLVRRPGLQSSVRCPVVQVDDRLIISPQRKFGSVE